METILEYFITTNGVGKNPDLLSQILDDGQIINNGGRFKIPSQNLYLLANVSSYGRFTDQFDDIPYGPVNNGFDGYLATLENSLNEVQKTELQQTGVTEASYDPSIFGYLNTTYDFTSQSGWSYLTGDLLEMGIVIYYDVTTDSIIISSIDTFVTYAQTMNNIAWGQGLNRNQYGSTWQLPIKRI